MSSGKVQGPTSTLDLICDAVHMIFNSERCTENSTEEGNGVFVFWVKVSFRFRMKPMVVGLLGFNVHLSLLRLDVKRRTFCLRNFSAFSPKSDDLFRPFPVKCSIEEDRS